MDIIDSTMFLGLVLFKKINWVVNLTGKENFGLLKLKVGTSLNIFEEKMSKKSPTTSQGIVLSRESKYGKVILTGKRCCP